jgi:hypothetical protein
VSPGIEDRTVEGEGGCESIYSVQKVARNLKVDFQRATAELISELLMTDETEMSFETFMRKERI